MPDIIHERTKTSRDAREIEDRLARQLVQIQRKIMKDPDRGQPSLIEAKYRDEVVGLVAAASQAVYLLGLDYVGKFEESAAILTPNDLANIRHRTDEHVAAFFRLINRDLVRVQENKKFIDLRSSSSLIAGSLAVGALATATVAKSQEMGDYESMVIYITAQDERVCPICRPLHRMTWNVGDPNIIIPVEDTHPNCRCRLLLKSGREVFRG